MDTKKVETIISDQMKIFSDAIAQEFDLIGIKFGCSHVASSEEEYVKLIATMVGLQMQVTPDDDTNYMCWLGIPIDDSDYVIKKDEEKWSKKLKSTPNAYANTVEGEIAMSEYMSHQTEIDEVEQHLMQRIGTYVFSGSAVVDNDVKYRRIGWLIQQKI